MRIFISYAHENNLRASQLAAMLDRMSYDVNIDKRLKGGEVWWSQILDWIEACDIVVFLLSRASLDSEACQTELAYASALNKPILPLRLMPIILVQNVVSEDQLPPLLRDRQYVDIQRVRSKKETERIVGALITLDKKIDQGQFPLPDTPPSRPQFPFRERPPIIDTNRDPATLVADSIQGTVGRLPARMQKNALLLALLLLLVLSQFVVMGLRMTSDQVQRTDLDQLLISAMVVFMFIGYMRGWTRELLSVLGIVLGLFIVHQLNVALSDRIGGTPTQQFLIEALVILLSGYFAYANPSFFTPPQFRGRDRVYMPQRVGFQDGVLGALVGAYNGYLLAGSLWYYLDEHGYPLGYFKIPQLDTRAAEIIDSLPQAWMLSGDGSLIIILLIAMFIFVLVAVI